MKNLLFYLVFVFCIGIAPVYSADWLTKTDWKLVFVTSEETIKYDEKALNAFDGKPSTHWFTRWSVDPLPLPQEIQIDLGKNYLIEAFSYLPRQSTGANGNIKDYEFYVCEESKGWPSVPVSKGTFANDISEKVITFTAPVTGRYIKLVGLREQKGSLTYMVAAEIGVKAAETNIEEIPWGNVKLTFTPSSDTRVTGHKVYWIQENPVNTELSRDVLKETFTNFVKADFLPGIVYKFTATAYATINGKFTESERSAPYYVKFTEPVIPIIKPSAPKLIRLEW